MHRPFSLLLLTLACLPFAAPEARADVNVTILNADKVQGTIDTADEVETFAIECPAGAKFVVAAKGKKGFQPRLRVIAPGETEPFAGDIVESKGAAKLKVPALETSGRYVVEVTGGGATGEYKLKVAWKSPKKAAEEVQTSDEPSEIPFSAGAGTRVNLKAVAAKSSAAVPELVRLIGPEGFLLDLLPPGKAASDSAKKIELPTNGDYTLFVRDGGTSGGAVKTIVALKQPKPSKRKVDMRAKTIGNAEGEQFALSDVVGKDGGSVVVPLPAEGEDPVSLIAGSSVQVPAGAVTTATPIVVATAPDVKPKGNDVGAGPSVFFGPEGLTFKEDVTVTIPFDPDAYQGDFSNFIVYTRDARGKVKAVPGPYDIDVVTGTCSFAVSHFSSFRAAIDIPKGGGNNAQFAGVWVDDSQAPEFTVVLEIDEDGSATLYELAAQLCIFFPFSPPGADLSFVMQIVDGNLVVSGGEIILSPGTAQDVPPPGSCIPFDQFQPIRAPK